MSRIFFNTTKAVSSPFPPADPHIRKFHRSLPHFQTTPLVPLPEIAKELGVAHLLVKDESSRLGLTAFKILGASWATAQAVINKLGLDPSNEFSLQALAAPAQAEGFVLYAATDGNHGRAVARMAGYLEIKARIFVPKFLDAEAKDKIAEEGAEVIVFDGDYDHTVFATKAAAKNHPDGNGVLVSDTALEIGEDTAAWMVEGYQTMFDEIEEQILDTTGGRVTHVICPVGVGSLAQAVVTHFSRTARTQKPLIITVEPEHAACLKASLEVGEMITVDVGHSICSGMCCGTLSATGWPILKDGIKAAIALKDSEFEAAVHELQSCNVNAGPCGAATLAGLRYASSEDSVKKRLSIGADSIVIIICTEGKRGYQMMG